MPVPSWDAEQPQECSICGDVFTGRDITFMPNFCEKDGCPGAAERRTVRVEPCSVEDGRIP